MNNKKTKIVILTLSEAEGEESVNLLPPKQGSA
jgi:hypothetical protein